jgi:hypothetical protein
MTVSKNIMHLGWMSSIFWNHKLQLVKPIDKSGTGRVIPSGTNNPLAEVILRSIIMYVTQTVLRLYIFKQMLIQSITLACWQTLSHNVVSNTPLLSGTRNHNASYIFKNKIYCVVTIDANRKLYLHIGNHARVMLCINICLKIYNRKTVWVTYI